jgi:hypothetical protein
MPLFRKQAVAVLEPQPEPEPEPKHPYTEQEAALRVEAGTLAGLEGEYARLSEAMKAARQKAESLGARAEYLRSPVGLAEHDDAEIHDTERQLVEAQRSEGAAQLAFEQFTNEHGHLGQRRAQWLERSKTLDHDITLWRWRQDWLKLLPQLEDVLIELARLQSIQWKEELDLGGVQRGVAGIPLDPKADGRATTAADILKIIAFQTRLFEGQPPAGVVPSSLRLTWWRGF